MALDNKVFTVSELTYAIKSYLEPQFRSITLQGEVSNFKKQTSGHLYFSLKDSQSQISAVLFKGNALPLTKLPQNGDQVIVKGELSIYPPRGNYQLIIRHLSFSGVGELLLKLHALKEKLKNQGYFDQQRKKSLPKIPKVIGVVTSPTGAVIQDIVNVLNRRFANVHLILSPVKVQGEGSSEEIAKAIDEFNKYSLADVLIIGRGGGSLEDLWAFNEEIVADAIFHSSIPVISAVGHETDYSIADFIADLRAPTPSAAAELVIAEKKQLQKQLINYRQQLIQLLTHLKERSHRLLQTIKKQPVFTSPYALIGQKIQQIDDYKTQLFQLIRYHLDTKKNHLLALEKQSRKFNPRIHIAFLSIKLKNITTSLWSAWQNRTKIHRESFDRDILFKRFLDTWKQYINDRKQKLRYFSQHLCAINPHHLLKKGYSILFSEKEDLIILSSKDVTQGQKVITLLHDGKIQATVDKIINK